MIYIKMVGEGLGPPLQFRQMTGDSGRVKTLPYGNVLG